MILQANEYEIEQKVILNDFFESTKNKFQTPIIKLWVKELYHERSIRKLKSN